jgi:hypothetical protein
VNDWIPLTADTDHFPATMGPTIISAGRSQSAAFCEQQAITVAEVGLRRSCARGIGRDPGAIFDADPDGWAKRARLWQIVAS